MARGDSGRIVIEVSPDLKRQLYSVLAVKNQTLKDWFVETASNYLGDQKDKIAGNLKEDIAKPPVKERL